MSQYFPKPYEPFGGDINVKVDLSSNDVKKDEYDKLVTKVNAILLNNIDPSKFVLKTKYDTDKSELENKIPDTNGLVKKTDYNAKISEMRVKFLILLI